MPWFTVTPIERTKKRRIRFPRIYALENCKSVTVGDKLAHQTLSHSFRRLPRGGIENAQFAEFSVLLQQVVLAQGSDRWTWTANGSGQFSVASTTAFVLHLRYGNKCSSFNQQVVGSAGYGD
ncbi:hypothetical protein Tco_1060540 [Tanacetum coccineum]